MKITLYHIIGILLFFKIGTEPAFKECFVDDNTMSSAKTVESDVAGASSTTCTSMLEEICANGIDDDSDGYIDADDPDCIAAGSCACPPGGTSYATISSGHTVPVGAIHCLTGDVDLTAAWSNIILNGSLYIVNGAHLDIDGSIDYGNDGNLIVCENASYVQQETVADYPNNIYNFGWLQICGTSTTVDTMIVGENSLTVLKGNGLTVDEFVYLGNPSNNAYLFLDVATNLNGSSGTVCLPGGTSEMIVEVDAGAITPSCVTDCNGCSELVSITDTCNDGSVEAAYLLLNPAVEICGNGIDDNGDGRIDEAYPGGVQSNLQLWLDAEEGTNTDVIGADITSWEGRSSNLYSANANINATDWPVYSSNAINFHPGVNFDGAYTDDHSDGLHLGENYVFGDLNGIEIFSVVAPNAGGVSTERYVLDFGETDTQGYGLSWSNTGGRTITPTAFGGVNDLVSHANGINPTLIGMQVDFENTQSLSQNGTIISSTVIPSLIRLTEPEIKEDTSYLFNNAGPLSIGRQSKLASFTSEKIFFGEISEVLIYDDTLFQSDREKVNSYLGIKYGLTLSHNYYFSDGTLIKDISDGYANNIAGIAVDSCGALIQKQSESVVDSSIISIAHSFFAVSNSANTSNFISDKSALIWGHNGAAANTSWNGTNYDIPNGGYLGIDRVWKFNETQDIQNVALRVDVDDPQFDLPALPPYPGSDGNYYVFIDDDGDFTNGGTTVQQLNPFGVSFWRATIADPATSYFSFGIKIPEICNDEIDNDGDGAIDCQDEDCSLTYYADSQTNSGVSSGDNVLGAPDFLNASFSDGDQMTIDLGSVLEIGKEYTLEILTGFGTLILEESIDGLNFFAASGSPYALGGGDITISTSIYTRYVRLTLPTSGFPSLFLDALSYDNCVCQSAANLIGEYSINSAPDIAGDSVLIFAGDLLRLDFVGTFNSEVFIWSGPNSLYQVNDSGLLRDHLVLNNIQTNQSGIYNAVLIDTLGCVDSASFFVNVVVPEICNNGVDDDGDGDIDCADSDCNSIYYGVSQTSTSVALPANILGAPDGLEASFGSSAQMVLDLGSALDVGEDYMLTLRYLFASGDMIIEESIDGINYFAATNSPYTISSSSLTDVTFTTNVHTRYLRLSPNSGDSFAVDAVTYGNCVCQPAASMVEEYQINGGSFVSGSNINVSQGDNLALNFVGGGFDDWVFIWTGPNSFYQVTDTGDGNSRDRLDLNNIQTNQAGEYKVVYYDNVGCVDSTSFTVSFPEICNNGVDDDGDGDIDCADSDCNTIYYAASQANTGSVINPDSLLGPPDGQSASIGTATSIVVDLGSALDIGEDYTLTLAFVFPGATIAIEESIDGLNFFPATGSPVTIPSVSLTDTTFTTTSHTRYLRLTAGSTIVRVDAITYGNCICQPAAAMIEEYEIDAGGFVSGSNISILEGSNLTLNFVGGGFDDWVFIWTGPNSFYQVTDTGDGNARDRLYLNNIQTNQAGEYKVVYFDNVGCVDSTSFTVNVFIPEICNNGLDDDGDGDIDCADSDCYLAVNSGDSDADSDGIGDSCDLDDDNDGILDTDENYTCLYPTPSSAVISTSSTWIDVNIPITAGHDYTFEADSSTLGTTNVIGGTFDGQDIILTRYGTDLTDLNGNRYNTAGNYLGGPIPPLNIPSANLTSADYTYELRYLGLIDVNGNGTFDSGTDVLIDSIFQVLSSVSYTPTVSGDLYVFYPDAGSSDNQGNLFFSVTDCININTDIDGDLVLNSFDLDSDNDGILDLDEAGHTALDANNDGIIDGAPSAFGINGFYDALETIADNGVINYSISNSESPATGFYDAYEIDGDGDTCFDALEAAVVDGDADGIAGTGAPVVTANGLVVGNVYTSPPNNEWQDPLVGSCLINCDAKAPVLSKN